MNPFVSIFRSLARQVEQRRRVALCTVVGSYGSTPQAAGAAMLLHENMTTEGTLGGGCVEAEVRKRALELLQRDESSLLTFKLDHDYGWDDGLICGGTMRVAVTPIRSEEQAAPFAEAVHLLEKGLSVDVPLRVGEADKLEEYRLHIEAPARPSAPSSEISPKPFPPSPSTKTPTSSSSPAATITTSRPCKPSSTARPATSA